MKIKNKAVTAAKINPSGLTVPNATHATSADSATNATNATNATTSSQLGGVAASHYLTKSATLTIPGVAFQPEGSGATQACIPETGSAGSGNILYAPVELPTGSTITKMTYYWWDDNGGDATATLNRIALPATDPKQVMATASSSGSAAVHTSSSTTSITNGTIDNSAFMYYVRIAFPGNVCVDAVQITYTG